MLAALLVFLLWYPAPAAQLLGVGNIFLILLGVDVVCGPLLTLVMASPRKPRRELILDLGLVALIQLAALGYGLYSLASARPVAYVFEQDRLVLVARNGVHEPECNDACSFPLAVDTIPLRIADLSRTDGGTIKSLDLSLQGVSPAMRPVTWRDWQWEDPKLQSALRPLSRLSPASREQLAALKGQTFADDHLQWRYLPLVSGKTLDWVVLFDEEGRWMEALPLDGF